MQGADVKGKPREVCQLGHLPHEHTIFLKVRTYYLLWMSETYARTPIHYPINTHAYSVLP